MNLHFYKYQGAGNDFILLDNRSGVIDLDTQTIAGLCNRHFGIGADGLMYLEQPRQAGDDFHMVYFNSDGRESTMCGNGGRCIARFAQHLGIVATDAKFSAIDGAHWARLSADKVELGMIDAVALVEKNGGYFVNTGSPHHVENRHADGDFVHTARVIRDAYGTEGANVNFIESCEGELSIRTYERGVENETLACGTGAVAAAIVAYTKGWTTIKPVRLYAPGGVLEVDFSGDGPFTNVVLSGPAEKVFEGTVAL
ncbi:MAG: hypothetical protein RL754_312 [Bacteroidota bacterium]|jgi:diaminopimelate epimerase